MVEEDKYVALKARLSIMPTSKASKPSQPKIMVFKDDKKVELMKENLRGDCLRGDGDKMGSVRKNTVASGNREDMVNTYEEPPDPGDHKYALVPRAIRDMETNVNVGGQPEMVEETMEVCTIILDDQ